MPAAIDRGERKHLLSEGHFIGFGMGLVLSRWWWAAVAWGAFLLAVWIKSMMAVNGTAGCENCYQGWVAKSQGNVRCPSCNGGKGS